MSLFRSYINGRIFLLLFSVFLISVALRIPNLNRPLSKHHEFVTAVSLRVLQIWEQDGASHYSFAPVMNYPGKANKFINNHSSTTGGVIDDEGNYYYVSHPPFAYLLPHYVFKVLRIHPTVVSLQIFHLFINFLSGLVVYILAITLRNARPHSQLDRRALIAYVIYIFSSAVLWFQSNTYMSDMLVHFFFLVGILTTIKCLKYRNSYKWKVVFALNLFLMIYTSWLGVFFAAVVMLGALTIWRYNRGGALLIYAAIATFASLSLIFFQYSSINGSEEFITQMLQRYEQRGSVTSGAGGSFLVQKMKESGIIVFNYVANYSLLLIFVVGGWIYSRVKKKPLGVGRDFAWLSLLPIGLLHVFLLDYSGHDFTVLYASCFLAITAAYIIDKFASGARLIPVILITVVSIGAYYYINRPGDVSIRGDRYDASMNFGLKIKEKAHPLLPVYVLGEVDPMVVVYAERNIIQLYSEEEANAIHENLFIREN